MQVTWFVYIVRCKGGALYTGITTDVPRRVAAHNSGQGARYTRGRAPVKLVYSETTGSRSQALRREAEIKRWTRRQKKEFIKG